MVSGNVSCKKLTFFISTFYTLQSNELLKFLDFYNFDQIFSLK